MVCALKEYGVRSSMGSLDDGQLAEASTPEHGSIHNTRRASGASGRRHPQAFVRRGTLYRVSSTCERWAATALDLTRPVATPARLLGKTPQTENSRRDRDHLPLRYQ